ncbi:MAG: cysteine desulfurase family protein, partial [Candidatus Methanosuratincola sp.]
PYLGERFGNPSSIHSFGMEAKAALDEAREKVAGFLGCSPGEVVFTSGGTESNNHAVVGAALAMRERGTHLVTTSVEHSSVLRSFAYLESLGFSVTYIGVDRFGMPDLAELRDSITPATTLVSVMYVNNETGVIMPVGEIAEIVKEKGALFHTDAVQAAGKLRVDLRSLPADLLSISSHKVYGPKGVGALFIRSGVRVAPFIHGGGQERGRRSGTENVPGIAGFGEACELARRELAADSQRALLLGGKLKAGLLSSVEGVSINGDPERRVAGTLNVCFPGAEGEAVVMGLDLEGIAVSTGSACSEGNVEPSHVLLAMGLTKEEALSSVRFSLGRFTTEEDIERLLGVLPRVVARVRLA